MVRREKEKTTKREQEEKTVCSACGGSGQQGFFHGESRFLLTMEECPHCHGTGYEPTDLLNGKMVTSS